MTSRLNKSLVLMALLATTACGGGGGDDPVITPTPGLAPNGLDYGAIGQALEDAEGTEMTLASADFTAGSGAQVSQGGSVTLNTGFVGGALNGTVQIFGETVQISGGTGTLPSNGQEVTVVYDPDRSGTYAGAVELISYGSDQAGVLNAVDGETHYVFGFETDPAYITPGSANYSGGFLANGLNNGVEAEYEGAITFAVNFGGNNVTGAIDGTIANTTDVDLTLGNTSVVGSGFNGALTCDAGCSGGAGTVDATFYGPNAEELGGVLALDFGNFEGAGTFIITVAP